MLLTAWQYRLSMECARHEVFYREPGVPEDTGHTRRAIVSLDDREENRASPILNSARDFGWGKCQYSSERSDFAFARTAAPASPVPTATRSAYEI